MTTQVETIVFVKGKREQDIVMDLSFLIANGKPTERAVMSVAYKYYTSADEVWELWQSKKELCVDEPCDSMRANRSHQIIQEFKYLLSLRSYTVEAVQDMVALKFGMEAESVYRLWRNKLKSSDAVPADGRQDRQP